MIGCRWQEVVENDDICILFLLKFSLYGNKLKVDISLKLAVSKLTLTQRVITFEQNFQGIKVAQISTFSNRGVRKTHKIKFVRFIFIEYERIVYKFLQLKGYQTPEPFSFY